MAAFASSVHNAFVDSAEALGVVGIAWRVECGGEVAQGCHGHSRVGGEELVPTQCWHWGSCAKALTATTVASLIDSGLFPCGWETKLGDVFDFPDADAAGLANASIFELATHRAGVCTDLELAEEEALALACSALPPCQQRAAFVRRLAAKPLAQTPGKAYGYSNAGYVALAVAAETVAGKPWEDLVVERVVAPLGMQSFGFGSPPLRPGDSCAVGHGEDGSPDERGDMVWHHASFSVHSDLGDWARFVRAHQQALAGDVSALATAGVSSESIAKLHMPVSPAVDGEVFHGSECPMATAMGWHCMWDEPAEGFGCKAASTGVLWHWGTNFRFNAGAYMRARPPLLMLTASNSGSSLARLAHRMAFEAVIEAAGHEECHLGG